MNFLGGSAASPLCIYPNTVLLNGSVPYHFIITVNATTVTTYFHNIIAASEMALINMSNWVRSMNMLFGQTLSPSPTVYTNTTWTGDVFLAAVYNRTLSIAEMQQNHAAGVLHSVPVPYPSLLWIVVDLTGTFTSLPSLAYNNTDSSTYAPITLSISSKPSRGSLYTLNGGYLSTRVGDPSDPLPFVFSLSVAFAYLPEGFAGYTDRFQYYVSHK